MTEGVEAMVDREGRALAFAQGLAAGLGAETPAGPVLMPSPGIYRSVFAWDSGWHWFWLESMDPQRARAELETLFSTMAADGRLPHETPLAPASVYGPARRAQLWLLRKSFAPDGSSWLVDPPAWLLAAALSLARHPGDRDAEDLRGKALAALGWIEGQRRAAFLEPPWRDFPALLHPLESGTDFSPSFEALWGRPPRLQLESLRILAPLARQGWSLAGRGSFDLPLLFDPCYLTLWLGARRYLLPGAETEELVEAFWRAFRDPGTGLFLQRGRLPGRDVEPLGKPTFSALLPYLLYARGAHAAESREALERWTLPGCPFWLDDLPGFNPGRPAPAKGLWRGACSWANMAFLHASLLAGQGWKAEARLLSERLQDRLEADGPWEYLVPAPTGKGGDRPGDTAILRGGGARPFSWNGLILPMLRGEHLDLCPRGAP